MQALIMVQGPGAQVPETQHRTQADHQPERQPAQDLCSRGPGECAAWSQLLLIGRCLIHHHLRSGIVILLYALFLCLWRLGILRPCFVLFLYLVLYAILHLYFRGLLYVSRLRLALLDIQYLYFWGLLCLLCSRLSTDSITGARLIVIISQ